MGKSGADFDLNVFKNQPTVVQALSLPLGFGHHKSLSGVVRSKRKWFSLLVLGEPFAGEFVPRGSGESGALFMRKLTLQHNGRGER